MALRRKAGQFWGDKRRTIARGNSRLQLLDATLPDKDVVRHSHDEPHFVWVLSGNYISGARSAPVASAMPLLVYTPAGVVHRDRFLGGKGSFVVVTFPVQLAASAEMSAVGGEARVLRNLQGMSVGREITDFVCGESSDVEGMAASCLALLQEGEQFRLCRPPPWLNEAFELIMEEHGVRRVADVAAAVGVHPVHLARAFQQCLGLSPGKVLRSRRMEKTAHQIARTRVTLAELSTGGGFSDQSHLSNQFRHAFDMSPLQWRRRHVAILQDD